MEFVTYDINISFEIPKMSLMLVKLANMWKDLVNLQQNIITLVTKKINRLVNYLIAMVSLAHWLDTSNMLRQSKIGKNPSTFSATSMLEWNRELCLCVWLATSFHIYIRLVILNSKFPSKCSIIILSLVNNSSINRSISMLLNLVSLIVTFVSS